MNKNIQRVHEMINGTYKRKIQVGYKHVEKKREVGEKWFDGDGKEWEQKNGYIASIPKVPSNGFNKCSECDKMIVKKIDIDTFLRMKRCYHCQIDFEVDLKVKGEWENWVKEQEIKRWESILKDMELEFEENQNINPFDMDVANAMSNENVSMEIKKNT